MNEVALGSAVGLQGRWTFGSDSDGSDPQLSKKISSYPRCELPSIYSTDTPVRERNTVCFVKPRGMASDNGKQYYSIFVNGIWNSEASSTSSAEGLAELLGRPVVRIYNDTQELPHRLTETLWPLSLVGPLLRRQGPPVLDLLNAVMGRSSDSLGRYVEPSVKMLSHVISEQLAKDSATVIDLHAHSQGAIILKNALADLRYEVLGLVDDGEWERLADSRLKVTTWGAAQHNFDHSNVSEYRHSGDAVPIVTGKLDGFKAWLSRQFGYEVKKSRAIESASYDHSFSSYLKSFPLFFVARELNSGQVTPNLMAKRVEVSMDKEEYGPQTYRDIIDYAVKYFKDAGVAEQSLRQLKTLAND